MLYTRKNKQVMGCVIKLLTDHLSTNIELRRLWENPGIDEEEARGDRAVIGWTRKYPNGCLCVCMCVQLKTNEEDCGTTSAERDVGRAVEWTLWRSIAWVGLVSAGLRRRHGPLKGWNEEEESDAAAVHRGRTIVRACSTSTAPGLYVELTLSFTTLTRARDRLTLDVLLIIQRLLFPRSSSGALRKETRCTEKHQDALHGRLKKRKKNNNTRIILSLKICLYTLPYFLFLCSLPPSRFFPFFN